MKGTGVWFGAVSLVVFIAFMMSPLLVHAASYNVGIKEGDWIKYSQFKVTWSGNGTEPSSVADEEKIDWVRMDVENVSGTTVTVNLTVSYDNGTQTLQTGSEDVASGFLSGSVLAEFSPIASDLKKGDQIFNYSLLPYPQLKGFTPPAINQTTLGIYAGAVRNTNLLELNETFSLMNSTLTFTGRIYWDQSTGAVVYWYEKSPQGEDNSLTGYTELSYRVTGTNMWSPDFVGTLYDGLFYPVADSVIVMAFMLAVITAIAVIVMLAVVVLRRKKIPLSPATR